MELLRKHSTPVTSLNNGSQEETFA